MLIHCNKKPVRIIGQGWVAKELNVFLQQENIESSCVSLEAAKSDSLARDYQYMIGICDNAKLRFEIVQWLSGTALDLCSWQHNQSIVNTDRIGRGVICYPFSLVLDATLENHCFIGPYCHVGHNAHVQIGAVLLPHSRMLGSSLLGPYSQLQSGACLLDKRQISADFVTILAGSMVTKNIDRSGVFGGFPARPVPKVIV